MCLACVENMMFMAYGENKRCGDEMCNTQLPSFDDVYVINLGETIELFKSRGREKIMECFNNFKPGDKWTQYFWAYYGQLGM